MCPVSVYRLNKEKAPEGTETIFLFHFTIADCLLNKEKAPEGTETLLPMLHKVQVTGKLNKEKAPEGTETIDNRERVNNVISD